MATPTTLKHDSVRSLDCSKTRVDKNDGGVTHTHRHIHTDTQTHTYTHTNTHTPQIERERERGKVLVRRSFRVDGELLSPPYTYTRSRV